MQRDCVRRDLEWWPDRADISLEDSVKPMKERYTINYFQYHENVVCVGMLSDWIRGHGEVCADSYIDFQSKLEGYGRRLFACISVRSPGVVMDSCGDGVSGTPSTHRWSRDTGFGVGRVLLGLVDFFASVVDC